MRKISTRGRTQDTPARNTRNNGTRRPRARPRPGTAGIPISNPISASPLLPVRITPSWSRGSLSRPPHHALSLRVRLPPLFLSRPPPKRRKKSPNSPTLTPLSPPPPKSRIRRLFVRRRARSLAQP
ncbi:hypothetical protein DAI22_03g130200 [Oryza sativa Japonica Group]|nr:hypothetical protein DAI22_03g130200 [Oryza sativa Japonica Group]